MDLAELEQALLLAHQNRDQEALVMLYQNGGQTFLRQGNIDAGCFYLTHAYIYALEAGHAAAAELRDILVSYGREE